MEQGARTAAEVTVKCNMSGSTETPVTHPRHKGEDVVLLILDGVFRVLLLTFLWAAKPNSPGLQFLLPPTYMGQTVTTAEKEKKRERFKS